MVNIALMAAVRQDRSEALGQANLEIDATQQNRTEVGRQFAAGEIGTDDVGGYGCKPELLWGRIHIGQGVFVLIG